MFIQIYRHAKVMMSDRHLESGLNESVSSDTLLLQYYIGIVAFSLLSLMFCTGLYDVMHAFLECMLFSSDF